MRIRIHSPDLEKKELVGMCPILQQSEAEPCYVSYLASLLIVMNGILPGLLVNCYVRYPTWPPC